MKHKHAEVIKAWADGATIQYMHKEGDWMVTFNPQWFADSEYRVKPEKVYPETLMTSDEIDAIFMPLDSEPIRYDLIAVANAAIRHAIDSGQVVVPESAMSQQK